MTHPFLQIKEILSRSGFAQSVAILAGGTALSQLLLVITSPLITRLYSPEDFGVLAVYMSLLGIFSTVASMRYELAIPLPEREHDACALVVLCLAICVGIGIAAAVLIWVSGGFITRLFKAPALSPFLWLLPIGIVLVGTYQTFNYWSVRNSAFVLIARTKLSQTLANVFIQIVFGFIEVRPLGLLLGDVAGRAAGTSLLSKGAWAKIRKVSIQETSQIAARYKRFPMISSFSALINNAGLQLPMLLLSAFYGPQVAGWYLITQRVIGIPVVLVGQATAQAYLGKAAELRRERPEELRPFFIRTSLWLFGLGGIPLGMGCFVAPWIFNFLFGQEWIMAGRMAQALALMYAVQITVYPLSQTLNVLERQDLQLAWDCGRLILVTLALLGAKQAGWGPLKAVAGFGVAMVASYLALGILNILKLGRS